MMRHSDSDRAFHEGTILRHLLQVKVGNPSFSDDIRPRLGIVSSSHDKPGQSGRQTISAGDSCGLQAACNKIAGEGKILKPMRFPGFSPVFSQTGARVIPSGANP